MIKATSLLALLAALTPSASAQGKNLLFYGSSYTYYVWGYGVPEVVQAIAVEAGHPAPTLVTAFIGGGSLHQHATDPAQVAVIQNGLPAGEAWDAVVMQGDALESTPHFGSDPSVFRAAAVTITGNVRQHSPAAIGVMYQTWANAQGHMYYPVPWPTPMDMTAEVRASYQLATDDILAAHGADSAVRAPIGDGVELLEFDPIWYEADMSHPTPAMVLLAGMILYTTIYGETVSELDPTFAPGTPLESLLQQVAIGAAEWRQMAGLADRCAPAALRAEPGSGDQLLLESATGAASPNAIPFDHVTLGTPLEIRMRSLNGRFDLAAGWLLLAPIVTGAPPGPSPLFPEIRLDLGAALLAAQATDLTAPLTFTISTPVTIPGLSMLVQGVALQASPATGNPLFTTTDAHELVFY